MLDTFVVLKAGRLAWQADKLTPVYKALSNKLAGCATAAYPLTVEQLLSKG